MKHIEATFLQFWWGMRDIEASQWEREIKAMRTIGIHTIILQWIQTDGRNLYESPDPFPQLLDIAHKHKIRVVFGLRHDGRWWREWGNAEYLQEEAKESVAIAREVYRRYGKHPAFAGFYIPSRFGTAPSPRHKLHRLRSCYALLVMPVGRWRRASRCLWLPFSPGCFRPSGLNSCGLLS
ncbi:MAG: DUF4434 domain-containing protein [Armatimonadota bacterium]